MEQQELRSLEKKCIQEEPPGCVAACPLHVDARTVIRHIVSGNWAEAAKTLYKTMPVPGILGRICDAPCRQRCKRGEIDDPIHIAALERCCVERIARRALPPPIARKKERVAVVGAGLGGLTAARDLSRKGYAVTVFEPGRTVGHGLLSLFPERLLPAHIDREVEILCKEQVVFSTAVQVESTAFVRQVVRDFNAVYLDLSCVSGEPWQLARSAEGEIRITPGLYCTSTAHVFAGGDARRTGLSPVLWAAQARYAATAIDRFLQGVSMTAGREKEGPFETRLYTKLPDIPKQKEIRASNPVAGFTDGEASLEAGRCLQCECLECVKHCVYLERFGAYPKKYVREIYNNDALVMGARQANRLINSCSLCGLCETLCPEGFAMQDLCLSARRRMVEKGKMPPSAHEFALADMAFSFSDRFSVTRNEPGTHQSRFAFFPGCQLCASSPEQVFDVYSFLRATLTGGTGLMLGCCAAPAYWAGRQPQFEAYLQTIKENWEKIGKPTIITACATCYRIFRDHLTEISIISLWQALLENGLPEGRKISAGAILSVHDPCTTRREPEIQAMVREILHRLQVTVAELPLGREKTECCGFGGLMQAANPALAEEVLRRRCAESRHDYLAYCAMCRDNLTVGGKRTLHLLDLLFPASDAGDPAKRIRPGWADRRENRERLKERFLTEIWRETPSRPTSSHRDIRLVISSDTAELLNNRRILREDIQKVIDDAMKTGRYFYHAGTGHYLASFRPYQVTFWVVFTPGDEGYVIHNAYSHRMEAGTE
jgi:glutamate synthase (NADPH) small chain